MLTHLRHGHPVEPKYILALKHARAAAVCVLFQFMGLIDHLSGGGAGAWHDFFRSLQSVSSKSWM